MRFLSIYKSAETFAPPSPEEMAKMTKLIEEAMKGGLVGGDRGLSPDHQWRAGQVRRRETDSHGRTFHRDQGTDRRIRPDESEIERRGDPIGQGLSESGQQRRVRDSPAV